MKITTAEKLMTYLNSKNEIDVIFALREIIKRNKLSPHNIKLFRSLDVVPVLVKLITTQHDKGFKYICIILCDALDSNSDSQILENKLLPILCEYLMKDDLPQDVLSRLCCLITKLTTIHGNITKLICRTDVPQKVSVLLATYEDCPQLTTALLQLLRNIMKSPSECIVLLNKKCIFAVCQSCFKDSSNHTLVCRGLKLLHECLYMQPSVLSIEQISDGTDNFNMMYSLFSMSDEITEILISIISKMLRICVHKSKTVIGNETRQKYISNIIFAKIPEIAVNLLDSKNKSIRNKVFDLTMKFLKLDIDLKKYHGFTGYSAYYKLWAQVTEVNGCKVLLELLRNFDLNNGMSIHEIRSEILSAILLANHPCTGSMVICQLAEGNIDLISFILSLINEYASFSFDNNNLPDVKLICGHLSLENCKVRKRKRTDENLTCYGCMWMLRSLINLLLMVLCYDTREVIFKRLHDVLAVLIKHVTNGGCVHKEALVLLVKLTQKSHDKGYQSFFSSIIATAIIPDLITINTRNDSNCLTCSRIASGRVAIVTCMSNLMSPEVHIPALQVNEEDKFHFFCAYVHVISKPARLIELNKRYCFTSLLLNQLAAAKTDRRKTHAFHAFLSINALLNTYEGSLSIQARRKIMDQFYLMFHKGEKFETGSMPCYPIDHHMARAGILIFPERIVKPCKMLKIDPDMEFKVEDQGVKVNRAHLSSQNPVFQSMLIGYFSEAKESVVPIQNWSYRSFRYFIHLTYGCENCEVMMETKFTLEEAYQLFLLADMYDAPVLYFYSVIIMALKTNLSNNTHLSMITNLGNTCKEDLYSIFLAVIFQNTKEEDIDNVIHVLKHNERALQCLHTGYEVLFRLYRFAEI